ncbi:unnamed protein product [Polarella glacialis]|uniref:Uncharacterized protein n=1 Tax=Polarella glacialis TaxID=89957 RepID=A0A813JJK0_POLGL|nr:unnamed protein product [Polarella glacialis]
MADLVLEAPFQRRRLDRDHLQQELCETVQDRQAFGAKLGQLRAEVRLIEASLQALAQKETWLLGQVSRLNAAPSLLEEDFLALGNETGAAGPKFFELEAGSSFDLSEPGSGRPGETGRSVASHVASQGPTESMDLAADDEDEEQSGAADFPASSWKVDSEVEDWEAVLDSMGVARCGQCGLRFPLDMAVIEHHSKTCTASPDKSHSGLAATSTTGSSGLSGRCSSCGLFLPLSVEGVERHVCEGNVLDKGEPTAATRRRLVFGLPLWPSPSPSPGRKNAPARP